MKKFFALPLAVLFVAACSDSSTAPANSADLSASYGKKTPPPPPADCGTCAVDATYDFEGGVIVAAGGTNVTTELEAGAAGTASDPNVITAPSGENFLGRFDNVHTAVLITVPAGNSKYVLDFDFYTIGSWDGRGKQAQHGVFDANVFDISTRCIAQPAVSLFKTSFSNQLTVQQDFPQAYLAGGNKAGTGSFAKDALEYRGDPSSNTPEFRSFGDISYHMSFAGDNPCGTAAFAFVITTSAPTLQSAYDESWGVDNVRIRAGT